MHDQSHNFVKQSGAALIMLLLLISMAVGALLMKQFDARNSEHVRQVRTLQILKQSTEALIGYAITHGRLPRPAISPKDGQENPQHCSSESACTGFLPWVTLGIDGIDSWGNQIRYSVTPNFANHPPTSDTSVATKTIQGRDSQGNLFFIVGQDICNANTTCSPAVVYTRGQGNSEGQDNIDEKQNKTTNRRFIQRASTTGTDIPGGEFDDLLAWLTLKEYLQRMASAGRLL